MTRPYSLDDKGKVKSEPARLNLQKNLLFAFDSLFEVVKKTKSPIDTSSRDWAEFREAIKIRDRLTHPKGPEDVRISVEEVILVIRAYNWFHALCVVALIGGEGHPTAPDIGGG